MSNLLNKVKDALSGKDSDDSHSGSGSGTGHDSSHHTTSSSHGSGYGFGKSTDDNQGYGFDKSGDGSTSHSAKQGLEARAEGLMGSHGSHGVTGSSDMTGSQGLTGSHGATGTSSGTSGLGGLAAGTSSMAAVESITGGTHPGLRGTNLDALEQQTRGMLGSQGGSHTGTSNLANLQQQARGVLGSSSTQGTSHSSGLGGMAGGLGGLGGAAGASSMLGTQHGAPAGSTGLQGRVEDAAMGKQDYGDKALAGAQRSMGLPQNRAVNEHMTDAARGGFEKATGWVFFLPLTFFLPCVLLWDADANSVWACSKKVPEKFSN